MKSENFLIRTMWVVVALSIALFSQPRFTEEGKTYEYQGETFNMGLYDGTNEMPAEHLAKGMAIAAEMRTMPKINIIDVGHSVPNTTFSNWNWSSAVSQFHLASNTNFKSASVPAKMAWDWVNQFKKGNSGSLGGFSASDIHVIAVQLTWAPFFGPDGYEKNTKLSQKIDSMSHDLERLAKGAKQSYPNLKMILMQADPWQNDHEPYHAYHEWFFARQVVMDQINRAPDYIGPGVDDVWIGLGGYWWEPNANKSYYTDCCHISGSGATYYREKWIKGMLEQNPVVAHWLAAEPTMTRNTIRTLSAVQNIHGIAGSNGVEVVFSLLDAARVGLGLFSIDGRAVVPVSEINCRAGFNSVPLTAGSTLAPGAYIVRVNDAAGKQSQYPVTITK